MHKEDMNEKDQREVVSQPPEAIDRKERSGTSMTDRGEGSSIPPVDQLSDVWRELLGDRAKEMLVTAAHPDDVPIPTLAVDPWSALLQAKGVEIVDLKRINLQISDQEVEQLLEVLPDDPVSSPPRSSNEEGRTCKETGLNN